MLYSTSTSSLETTNYVFNWILLIIVSYFSSFPLFLSGFLGKKEHSITSRSISLHSRLQLTGMERGDRLANRWVMCGLWMTYSGALRESVSKCSSLRAELASDPLINLEREGKLKQGLFYLLQTNPN